MAGKSTYLQGKVLDDLFGISSFSPPGILYVGLHKGDPTDAGSGGAEVSGGSYSREAVTNDATEWSRTGSVVTNDNDVDFGTATADWGTSGDEVTHVTVWDASTSGNLLYSAPLTAPRIILNGDPVKFVAGQLQFTED